MASGLASGISSGLGSSLGTSAAGSAAGQAAASTAAQSTAGQIGSALGSAIGGSANQGAGGNLARIIMNGSTDPASGTEASSKASQTAADPSNSKGGWLGMGLFGNDKYNPNPSTYAPQTGSSVSQAAMPKIPNNIPIALQLLQGLPQYNQ